MAGSLEPADSENLEEKLLCPVRGAVWLAAILPGLRRFPLRAGQPPGKNHVGASCPTLKTNEAGVIIASFITFRVHSPFL